MADHRLALREDALTSGELGATAAQTVVVALAPVLLSRHTSSALAIGAAVGGEGIFAFLLPVWVGALSDRLSARRGSALGGRMTVVGGAALLLAAAVGATPFFRGYLPISAAALVSFAALHAFLTPFWALTVDAVPDERRARVQGTRGIFRAAGLAYGLVAAGLLFGIWPPLPFLVAGALVLGTTGLTALAARSFPPRGPRRATAVGEAWRALLRNRPALWVLAADACWNAAVDGIRPYVFLYAQRVLGTTIAQTSLGLMVLVGTLGAGSWVAGRLGDRHDRASLLWAASLGLAAAFAVGFAVRDLRAALVLAAVAGCAASFVMTLPYPLYAGLVGEEAAGQNTGLYVASVTVGRIGAPVLVGGAVDLAARVMPRTQGYPAMWLVAAALAAAGGLCVRQARAPRAATGRGAPGAAPPRAADR